MRDTTVSQDDLAIEAAKQKLATIKERPGYVEAMRPTGSSNAARIGVLAGAAASGGIAYACWHYVTAAWLMWILVVIFGGLALLLLFALLGFSQKADHWATAIVGKRIENDKHVIAFLTESGEQREVSVSESLYDAVRPGDLGVVTSSGSGDWLNVDAFERL